MRHISRETRRVGFSLSLRTFPTCYPASPKLVNFFHTRQPATQPQTAMNIDWRKVEQPDIVFQRFPSRRSVVYGAKGIVAASQPLAAEAGLEILRKGGNAGDCPCDPI